jgi:hypothetical protein
MGKGSSMGSLNNAVPVEALYEPDPPPKPLTVAEVQLCLPLKFPPLTDADSTRVIIVVFEAVFLWTLWGVDEAGHVGGLLCTA